MILETDKERIIAESRERLAEIASEYVDLTRGPAGNLVGLCPFHKEKTGSFTLNKRGFYHCFGCGAGGDAAKFVMAMTGKSFPGALRHLADRLGIPIQENGEMTPEEKKDAVERREMLSVLSVAVEFYRQRLASPAGEQARSYLTGRGVEEETISAYRLGYALDEWQGLVKHLTGKTDVAERLGLIKRNKHGFYDVMRARIIFPIVTRRGEVIAIAGRVLDGSDPKYLNSPESPLYSKSDTLFGANLASESIRNMGTAIVVEGYMDHINLYGLGVRNVLATCGTALTRRQVRRAMSCGANTTELMFDGDEPGQAATKKGILTVWAEGAGLAVRVLPPETDPGDLSNTSQMPAAMDAEEFLFRNTPKGVEMLERLEKLGKTFQQIEEARKDPMKALALRMLGLED